MPDVFSPPSNAAKRKIPSDSGHTGPSASLYRRLKINLSSDDHMSVAASLDGIIAAGKAAAYNGAFKPWGVEERKEEHLNFVEKQQNRQG